MTDEQIIQQVRAGDTDAFQYLYAMHKRRVYSLCLRMTGDHATAEDITQESFLLAFKKIRNFRGDSAFSTWLHRVAVNTVLMHIRSKASRGGTQSSLDDLNAEGEPIRDFGQQDLVLHYAVDRLSLLAAIEQLPQGYRMIFILHDVEGYDHAEIASLLGCSVGNTKSQLHKARLKLRRLLVAKPEAYLTEESQEARAA